MFLGHMTGSYEDILLFVIVFLLIGLVDFVLEYIIFLSYRFVNLILKQSLFAYMTGIIRWYFISYDIISTVINYIGPTSHEIKHNMLA